MATSLRTKAVERSIKTNSAAYYSYVDDSKNPVLQSFATQISDFKNYVAKQQKSNQDIDGRLYVAIILNIIISINSLFQIRNIISIMEYLSTKNICTNVLRKINASWRISRFT